MFLGPSNTVQTWSLNKSWSGPQEPLVQWNPFESGWLFYGRVGSRPLLGVSSSPSLVEEEPVPSDQAELTQP